MRQLTFEDVCQNRHGGRTTSRQANARVRKEADRERVYQFIEARGRDGATLDEVSVAFGREPNRLSGRCTELRAVGRIASASTTRRTRTGSPATVYVATRTR